MRSYGLFVAVTTHLPAHLPLVQEVAQGPGIRCSWLSAMCSYRLFVAVLPTCLHTCFGCWVEMATPVCCMELFLSVICLIFTLTQDQNRPVWCTAVMQR
jgi:hypothetical protein